MNGLTGKWLYKQRTEKKTNEDEYQSLSIKKKEEKTDIIKRILSTSMQQPMRKIPKRKLHPIINPPKRSPKRIRYTSKPTTRSRVGFEHVKRFVVRLG